MFTLVSTVPVANSICDGPPTPIASGRPASAITSRTTCSTPSSSASALTVTVGCSLVRIAETPSTAATATLVPPTSTPRTTRDSYLRERLPASLADVGVGARKIRVRVGVSLDAIGAAAADACPMLISQSTRYSELQSRLHGQVLTD